MIVCWRCLLAIESREGDQISKMVYVDKDEVIQCEWYEEEFSDEIMYEI